MEFIKTEVEKMIIHGAGFSACLAYCLNQVAFQMQSQEDYFEYKRYFERLLEEEFGLDPEEEDDFPTTASLVGSLD